MCRLQLELTNTCKSNLLFVSSDPKTPKGKPKEDKEGGQESGAKTSPKTVSPGQANGAGSPPAPPTTKRQKISEYTLSDSAQAMLNRALKSGGGSQLERVIREMTEKAAAEAAAAAAAAASNNSNNSNSNSSSNSSNSSNSNNSNNNSPTATATAKRQQQQKQATAAQLQQAAAQQQQAAAAAAAAAAIAASAGTIKNDIRIEVAILPRRDVARYPGYRTARTPRHSQRSAPRRNLVNTSRLAGTAIAVDENDIFERLKKAADLAGRLEVIHLATTETADQGGEKITIPDFMENPKHYDKILSIARIAGMRVEGVKEDDIIQLPFWGQFKHPEYARQLLVVVGRYVAHGKAFPKELDGLRRLFGGGSGSKAKQSFGPMKYRILGLAAVCYALRAGRMIRRSVRSGDSMELAMGFADEERAIMGEAKEADENFDLFVEFLAALGVREPKNRVEGVAYAYDHLKKMEFYDWMRDTTEKIQKGIYCESFKDKKGRSLLEPAHLAGTIYLHHAMAICAMYNRHNYINENRLYMSKKHARNLMNDIKLWQYEEA